MFIVIWGGKCLCSLAVGRLSLEISVNPENAAFGNKRCLGV